ncbi:MAG: peptide/nickel transport system permease protein [Chloroflexota bacterium]|nr:peptide/nickel transport system permease protein [Chloroflexota bacterium]
MNRFFTFLTRRLLLIPITLLVITVILYGIVMLMPLETRISLYMPKSNSMAAGWQERMRTKIIDTHHLDQPFPVQYAYWLRSLATGDWGFSPMLNDSVLPQLLKRTPVTLELILYSLLLQIPLGLVAGIVAAQHKGKFADVLTRFSAFFAASMPDFILAFILLAIFYVSLYWFPPERLSTASHLVVTSASFHTYTGLMTVDGFLYGRPDISLDAFRHLVLPVFTLSFAHWATLTRLIRSQVLEEMDKDYITAAYARGVDKRRAVWRHAFRNTLGPALNASAVSAATLVTGAYVVERIFNLNGISDLITRYGPMVPDAPAVLGFSVYSTLLVLLIMLALDILQAILLPHIKEETFNNEKI